MRIEKQLFEENKKIIKESTIVEDRDFKAYNKHYQSAVKNYKKIATLDEVLQDFHESRVILFGDYHTLDQSQRNFMRLMRHYLKKKRHYKIAAAFEAVQTRHQKHLQDFMVGRTTEETFLKKIGFRKNWFFDLWPHYQAAFDFLMHYHIPIFGIDADLRKELSLARRDAFMAEQILALVQKYPEDKIVVLVGDLHLAPDHLPNEIKILAKKQGLDIPILTLYQNSPEIYWQLSEEQHFDHALLVKMADKEYCRMHTPPLVVQQSYLNWLYHEGESFDWIDAKQSFLNMVERMATLLNLKLTHDYESVEVYTCGDLSFLSKLKRQKLYSKLEFDFVKNQVEKSSSCFLPQARLVYLANVSLHHAAQEASQYLKFLLSGPEFPRERRDAFYARVLREALGFFGSKIINSKRRCPRWQDFKNELHFLKASGFAKSRHLEYETAQLFLQHARFVRRKKLIHTNRIANMSAELFLALTQAIGYDFGDLLYYGFMAGQLTKDKIRKLYVENFEDEGEPGQVYLEYLQVLQGLKRPGQL